MTSDQPGPEATLTADNTLKIEPQEQVQSLSGIGEKADFAPPMADVRLRVAQSGRNGGRGFESFMDEQPLVAGALAMALGAAIGSALPRTRTEDKLVGEESDRLKQNLSTTAEQEGSRLARTVADVADEAKTIVGEAANDLARTGASAVDRIDEKIGEASDRLRQRAAQEAATEELHPSEPRR